MLNYGVDISQTTLSRQDVINRLCSLGATVLEYEDDEDMICVYNIDNQDLLNIEGIVLLETFETT